MHSEAGMTTPAETAQPPRYWWLKRILLLMVAVACLLTGMRLWWGYAVQRKMDAYIADLRARGEPVFPEDLNVPPLPDEQNAAYFLGRAAQLVSTTAPSPRSTSHFAIGAPPYPPKWHSLADAAMAANQQSLAQAREARSRDQADWGIRWASHAYLFHLDAQGTLACFLADAAMHAHINGDDAEALERIADIMHQARIVGKPPFMITYVASVGGQGLATQRLCVIAPELRIADETEGSATRQQVRAMIEQLLDEAAAAKQARECFLGDRVLAMDNVSSATRSSRILRPMYDLDSLYDASITGQAITAILMPNALTAMAQARAKSGRLGDLETRILFSPFRELGTIRYVGTFERRAAAVSLAVRLYRLDHEGEYPPTLAALVPDCLPSVPADPFAPDDRPVGYVIIGGRPLVYSVGTNGVDDTAAGALPPDEPSYDWGYYTTADEWRDLSRWRAPGSGQVLEEQNDETDTPGEGDQGEEADQQP